MIFLTLGLAALWFLCPALLFRVDEQAEPQTWTKVEWFGIVGAALFAFVTQLGLEAWSFETGRHFRPWESVASVFGGAGFALGIAGVVRGRVHFEATRRNGPRRSLSFEHPVKARLAAGLRLTISLVLLGLVIFV